MPKFFRLTKVKHTANKVGFLMRVVGIQKSWRMLLTIAIVVVGSSYLVTVISLSTHGYKIRDLEKNIQQLKLENKKLNLEISEKRSLSRIEQWIQDSEMVLAADIQYISPTTGVVAAR